MSLKTVWLRVRIRFPFLSIASMKKIYRFAQLYELISILRGPRGCPWDKKQTYRSMIPFLYEEVLECMDAINRNSTKEIQKEFGDILFVVFFIERLLKEEHVSDFSTSIQSVIRKMIFRHPHVFDQSSLESMTEIEEMWKKRKQQENPQTQSQQRENPQTQALSAMKNIPKKLSSLRRAFSIGEYAKTGDFDWTELKEVWNKVHEELDELEEAIEHLDKKEQQNELGDLLFSITQVARHLKIDPELGLHQTCTRFIQRFEYIEKQTKTISDRASPNQLETFWQEAKKILSEEEE